MKFDWGLYFPPVSHYAVAYLIEGLREMGLNFLGIHPLGQVCWRESLEGQDRLTRPD